MLMVSLWEGSRNDSLADGYSPSSVLTLTLTLGRSGGRLGNTAEVAAAASDVGHPTPSTHRCRHCLTLSPPCCRLRPSRPPRWSDGRCCISRCGTRSRRLARTMRRHCCRNTPAGCSSQSTRHGWAAASRWRRRRAHGWRCGYRRQPMRRSQKTPSSVSVPLSMIVRGL